MTKKKNKKDWFSLKGYPHIGFPMEYNDINIVKSYILNPTNISKHAFLPLIHRKTTKRKFRKEYSKESGLLLNDGKRVLMKSKERELYYSTDIDANIYSYYAHLLSLKYEVILKERNLIDIASAYRRIPLDSQDEDSRNKCNVDFADEVFTYIIDHKEDDLVAIAFDISSFFDNLDHKLLKRVWCEVLGTKCLSDDHYKVFKGITNYSFVEESDLFKEFKDDIFVKRYSDDKRKKLIKRRISIKRSKYLKNQKAVAYCSRKDFKKRILGNITIKTNNKKRIVGQRGKYKFSGIPQGSPISAVLANVYMLNFDTDVNAEIDSLGGIYRRYSDDMIVVCSRQHKDSVINLFKQEISKYLLDIKDEKTQVFHFINSKQKLVCYEEVMNEKKGIGYCTPNTNFAYLGFEFDGEFAKLKSVSLSQHNRKMKRSVRRCGFYASHSEYKAGEGKMFIRRLYKRFSHLGATRRMKYVRDKSNQSLFHKSNKHDWGNYLTYTNMAARNMKCPNVISNQVKRQWRYLNEEIEKIKIKNHLE